MAARSCPASASDSSGATLTTGSLGAYRRRGCAIDDHRVGLIGRKVITHSILMRSQSRSVRYIKTVHDLDFKTIRRSPDRKDHYV